jgi:hypothetical protein
VSSTRASAAILAVLAELGRRGMPLAALSAAILVNEEPEP